MYGLDAWLEAPYVDAARREEEFERFCGQQDVNPEDADAWTRFEEYVEDQMYDAELDAAERAADYAREEE